MTVLQISEHEYIGVAADSKPAAAARAKFYETDTGRTYIYTGSAWTRYLAPVSIRSREDFLSRLLAILGDARVVFLPTETDTTTSTDKSANGKTITHNGGSFATRLERLGLGYAATFNGTSQYSTVPDAANLSFGNGSADSPFSIVTLTKPSAQAAVRKLVSKEAASNNEYLLQLGSTDLLAMAVLDQSASAATEQQIASGAITEGAWQMLSGSYSGAGGTSASAGIVLFRDGVAFASASSDSGTYVAMEDLTSLVGIGGKPDGTSLFAGSMALVAITQKNLAAWEHWAIRQLCIAYFDYVGA